MKLLKMIKNFFLKISSFIDKKIVVPITKLVLLVTSKFDTNGRKFENLLSRTNTLLFISLFLAAAVFIIIDQKIIVFTDNATFLFIKSDSNALLSISTRTALQSLRELSLFN